MMDVDGIDMGLVLGIVSEHGHDGSGVVEEQDCRRDPAYDFDAWRHVGSYGENHEEDGEPEHGDERNRRSGIPSKHFIDAVSKMFGHVGPYRDFRHASTSDVGFPGGQTRPFCFPWL